MGSYNPESSIQMPASSRVTVKEHESDLVLTGFRRPLSGSIGSYLENAIPMTTTLVNRDQKYKTFFAVTTLPTKV